MKLFNKDEAFKVKYDAKDYIVKQGEMDIPDSLAKHILHCANKYGKEVVIVTAGMKTPSVNIKLEDILPDVTITTTENDPITIDAKTTVGATVTTNKKPSTQKEEIDLTQIK